MSPEATRVLVGELLAAGVDLMAISEEAKRDGRISEELADEIEQEVRYANDRWEEAGGRDD